MRCDVLVGQEMPCDILVEEYNVLWCSTLLPGSENCFQSMRLRLADKYYDTDPSETFLRWSDSVLISEAETLPVPQN
jgi:hypothetical protein